ncbi:MAG: lactoylglutathione lyase [Bacteroidales bacterium]|nr:lactoylglutathione lyase [Bacteroidales bacterium]
MKIKSRFDHYNINVRDLDKSLEFYEKALGMKEVRRKDASDGSFTLVYIGEEVTGFTLELTWLRDWDRAYNLGDNEQHLCVRIENDYDEARAYHKKNGWVCYENEAMGLYFINDPDGYWIEILALDRK